MLDLLLILTIAVLIGALIYFLRGGSGEGSASGRPSQGPDRARTRALISLAFLWSWTDMAVLIFLAFGCMLRPGEAFALRAGDIVLPSRVLGSTSALFVKVRAPKARWAVARLEHERLDEPALVRFLELWVAGIPDSRKKIAGSYTLS